MQRLVIMLFCFMTVVQMGDREAHAFYYGDVGPPGPLDIHIGKTAIVMPLGKILLVRKDSNYCAIKFTEFWSENASDVGSIFVASGTDEYAVYESYFQKDKTGDFSKRNVQIKKEKLSFPKPRGLGRLAFSFGNREIKCGNSKLLWSGKGSVHFFSEGQPQGDYGVELSPTKWTDILQINAFDQRLKWYRFDEKRQRINVPVDKLWED